MSIQSDFQDFMHSLSSADNVAPYDMVAALAEVYRKKPLHWIKHQTAL